MADTRSLNNDDSVYVTTFFGGEIRGRCYDFTVNRDGIRVRSILTENELFHVIAALPASKITNDDGFRPEFTGR